MTVHVTNIGEAQSAAPSVITPVRPMKSGVYRAFGKRVLDTVLILLALPFVLPFALIVSLIIALDGHSPFYRQERVGKDGRRFMMWKFRTMVPNAASRLKDHLDRNPADKLEWAATQKLKSDPRCTRFGRALRRSSLDEIPQLLNVLSGDMSLIGPRPMMPEQQTLYPGSSYYRLRPGISGFWQVSARNESEFAERAHYDDQYHERMSFRVDVKLMARTLVAVLRGTGY